MDIASFVHQTREQALALGDYASYRAQLSRQVVALRRKLKIATPKNHKYTKKGPLTSEQVTKDKQYVNLQLLTSERAWAHAMAVKSAHAQDNASEVITGSTRKFIISRLHKAAVYASNLVSVLSNKVDTGATEQDYLDALAYSRCLDGSVEFEKQFSKRFDDLPAQKSAWKNCLVFFSEAHVIYSALLHSTQSDVYKEVIAGNVDPSIRYAAYQSRIPRTIAISTVAKRNFRTDQKALLDQVTALHPAALSEEQAVLGTSKEESNITDVPTTVVWRGRTAPIADASIGQALAATSIAAEYLATQLSTSTSAKALAAAYDPILTAAQDTVDAVRRAIGDLTKEGIPESDNRMQDLRVTDLAANYALISWRIGRNRVLTASSPSTLDDGLVFTPPTNASKGPHAQKQAPTTKPASRSQRLAALRDRSVLLHSTLQSLDAIAALPGASRDTAFIAELDAQRAYFRALRCLNIGYAHAALGRGKEREALALYARAAGLAAGAAASAAVPVATSTLPAADAPAAAAPALAIASTLVKQLQAHAAVLVDRQRGLVALHQLADGGAPAAGAQRAHEPPLCQRGLDVYPAGEVDLLNLVPYPPRLLPVPVKPIFLDLAWNHIDYPGQEGKGATDRAAATVARAAAAVVGNGGDTEMTGTGDEGGQKKKGWFGFGR
ncbi:hypothetical protein FH972_021548 [Carpinus fangiana]|uniref:Signal recognition particle subunit SRP68 n=1 Tax=Carpinus fangiana TaxID=176857 RepID=A0A5N6KQ06_9ROSI|nr:hypothetical protein FH972_021548 [Carpinus fangiana]